MKRQSNSSDTKSEQIFRELQESRVNKPSSKKKRFSRIIMAFDAVVILIILVIMSTRNDVPVYHSADINISGTKIRFSLSESKETKNYIFTLTFNGGSAKTFKKRLKSGLGTIRLLDGEKTVVSKNIGKGMKLLKLDADEVKVFSTEMERDFLDSYLRDVKKMEKQKKSILNLTSQYYRFKIAATLNFNDPISIPLEIKHEVKI